MAMQSLGMIILILAVLLVVGVPISYSIGIASLFTILQTVPLDISVVTGAQRIFVGMSKFSLTAIPFFILAGNLMNQGGIAKRLVNFVMAILGKLPGALLVTNVGANALFGAISGSASAAAAAVGSMVLEGEHEQGYDEALCAATNGASAPSGLLIPPSNALITYSLAAGGTSVAALFMAGYLPGIIWALCCMVVAIIIARKKGYKGTPGKFSWSNLGKATLQAIPSLSLIIVVIGGIIAGVFSATEGSAIAVVYALILGICYRNITWKSFWNIGSAFHMMMPSAIASTGMTARNIHARFPPMTKAMTAAKTIITGQRTAIRTIIIYAICRFQTSVVIRVTSEGVEYLSMFSKENVWIL